MRVTKVVSPTTAVTTVSTPQEERRREFIESIRILGAPTGYAEEVKTITRRQIGFRDKEEVIQHILALWPEQMRKFRKHSRRDSLLLGSIIFLSSVWWISLSLRTNGMFPLSKVSLAKYDGVLLILLIVVHLLRLPISRLALRRELDGMAKLLFEYRDVRLLGACIEALNVANGDEREVIVKALRDLLPLYARADVPPFTDYQQKILLRELKRLASRWRKKGALVTQEDASMMVGIVSALEADAIRATALPGAQTPRTLSGIENALTGLEKDTEKAGSATDAVDVANRRRVHLVTENAVLRLRGLREGN